jgi:hypothetical protein
LTYILRTHGRVREKTQGEIRDRVLNDDISDWPAYSVGGPGVGVKIEASCSTDTLRALAARGEWGLFWAWPFFQFSWATAVQLFATAFFIAARVSFVAWITGLIFVPAALAEFFMAGSALKTKNDDQVMDAPHSFDRK